MALDRLQRVRGATRIITTRWREQRREADLIGADEGRQKPTHVISLRVRPSLCRQLAIRLDDGELDLCRQLIERRAVGVGPGEDHHVHWAGLGKESYPCDLAQAPAQEIPAHDRFLVERDDDADTRVRQKGSEGPNLEVLGSDSLPCPANVLQLPPARDAMTPREGNGLRGLRRRRTCSAA